MASLPIDPQSNNGAPPEAAEPQRTALKHKDVRVALWPIMVVLYATLLPREVRVTLGTFEIYADRIALLIVLPYVLRKLMQGAIRFVLPDVLVLFAGVWMIGSMLAHYGLSPGLERGGSAALDSTVGYFLARISFRSLTDMRRALVLLLPGVTLVGAVIVFESISHISFLRPLAAQIFGPLPLFEGGSAEAYRQNINEIRLGLYRARGPFEHAIHAGLFMASLVGIYNLAGLRGYPRLFANLVAPLAFFTVSSAAMLGLALGYGLIAYEFVQRQVRELSWRLFILAGTVFIVVIELASNSGVIGLLSRYLTFDAQTAFYRQLIWDFGSQTALRNPLIGIGYADYERPVWMVSNSVDAHWLLLALRDGIPCSLSLLAASVIALIGLSRASAKVPRADQLFYRGIAISLFVLIISMFTVYLWGGVAMWFTVILGACVACSQRSYKAIKVEVT
ncbi:MAG TPA: hypothetical protein PKD92_06355 [Novosphingobium sp.]|nr:hypothetical protein [Novosphingobium sp.]